MLGVSVSLFGIFLLGLLLVLGVLLFWCVFGYCDGVVCMLVGVNVVVVGLLVVVFYDLVWVSVVCDGKDFVIVFVVFIGLVVGCWFFWVIVVGCVIVVWFCMVGF